MHFPSTQSSPGDPNPLWPSSSQQTPTHFFDLHPVGAILRSLLMSSLLWILLAFALYSVYSFVVTTK